MILNQMLGEDRTLALSTEEFGALEAAIDRQLVTNEAIQKELATALKKPLASLKKRGK